MEVKINKERLIETFIDLVKIDSPSGEEKEVGIYLEKRLKAMGFEVKFDSYGNLIASEPGKNHMLLSCHMDTVEPGRGIQPIIEGNKITSDGTTILGGDAKAGVAAILEGLQTAYDNGIDRIDLQPVFTREEEIGLVGAQNVDFNLIIGTHGVVFDGNGSVSRVFTASPTYIGFNISVKGRAAHAGVEPEKGLSAIRIASELITNLEQGRLDEETTFNIGKIEGGTVRNAVPENTQIEGEFRSHNLETIELLQASVKAKISEFREKYPEAEIIDSFRENFAAYKLTADDSMVKLACSTMIDMGIKPTLETTGGGTDANVFNKHGIPCVVVGMGTNDMHTVREYVKIDELEEVAQFCLNLISKK